MVSDTDATNRNLIERIRAGDTAALEEVYRTQYVPLIKIAVRYLRSVTAAEDILHDVFIALWERRAELVVQRDLKTYLSSAVRHRAIDEIRRRVLFDRISAQTADDTALGMGSRPPTADQALRDQELDHAITTALQRLPERSRQVLLLRWRQRMSYDDIAQALGISVAAAKQHGSRGLAALRPFLEQFLE